MLHSVADQLFVALLNLIGYIMSSTKGPRRGRPPKEGTRMTKALTIRFPAPMWAEIEKLQKSRLDAPDSGSVVRELVAEALHHRKSKK